MQIDTYLSTITHMVQHLWNVFAALFNCSRLVIDKMNLSLQLNGILGLSSLQALWRIMQT